MTLTWYGNTCFRILTQREKNHAAVLLIDVPGDTEKKATGIRAPRGDVDMILSTRPETLPVKTNGEAFAITGPGEYDIKGVYIQGISVSPTTTVYTIAAEGLRMAHLGKLQQSEVTSELLEKLGEVDILLIPAGDADALSAEAAVKAMAQIEPKIIIPMQYKIPGLKVKLDGLEKLMKALGIKSLPPVPKLSVKKRDLSSEEAKVVVLQAV